MPITNITELIRNNSLTDLLRLAGAKQEEIGESASDYIYFQAVCRAIPLLQGHKFVPLLYRLFELMQIDYSPKSPNAESIWMQCSDYLERNDLTIGCLEDLQPKSTPLIFDSWHKSGIHRLLNVDSWQQTKACDWTAWERELNDSWKMASSCDYIKLSIDLPEKTPSLYHVDLALRSRQDDRILSAQLLRFLCMACRNENKTLLVEVKPQQASRLCAYLKRLENTLELPSLVLSVPTMQDLQPILEFAKQPHKSCIRLGASRNVLNSALDIPSIAATYPIGCLLLYEIELQILSTFSIVAKGKEPDC